MRTIVQTVYRLRKGVFLWARDPANNNRNTCIYSTCSDLKVVNNMLMLTQFSN